MVEERTLQKPLLAKNISDLKQAKVRATEILSLIQGLENCGVNCGDRDQIVTELHQMAEALVAQFPRNGKRPRKP